MRQAAFHIKPANNAFPKHLLANARRRSRLGDTIIKHFARARRCNLLFPRVLHTESTVAAVSVAQNESVTPHPPTTPPPASATNQRRTWFELYDVEMNFTTGKHAYYARSGRRFFADVAAGSFFTKRARPPPWNTIFLPPPRELRELWFCSFCVSAGWFGHSIFIF